MSDFFPKAVAVVLGHEGGFVDNPVDNGGPTNKGLTLHDLKLAGLVDNVETLKALTDEQACQVYKSVFWDPEHYGELSSGALAVALFDQGVLEGTPRVVKALQSLLGVPEDGILGPMTLAAVNAENGLKLAFRFLNSRAAYYTHIVRGDPSQVVFLDGWIDRILSLAEYIATARFQ